MTAVVPHAAAPRRDPAPHGGVVDPAVLGRLAADALRAEALLTPKPGLVDRRGNGAHHDMDLALLLRSADTLEPWFVELARTAAEAPGTKGGALVLRQDLGRIGRQAEAAMLETTGGVNTHRGALYSVGLLVAGAAWARAAAPGRVTRAASALARLRDVASHPGRSHGDLVREEHPCVGAARHAGAGFPATVWTALPMLRATRRRGGCAEAAQLDALVGVMAVLDDTCVLYRGGRSALALVRSGAAAVVAAGGALSPAGRRELARLDRACRAERLSPGGAADVLATAVFLDDLDRYDGPGRR